MRFMILTAVIILMTFFWVRMQCGLIGRKQRFGEPWSPSSGLKMETTHGDSAKKNIIGKESLSDRNLGQKNESPS